MAFNSLDESDPIYQQKVRERAYHLWEAEGRRHGRDHEYWERARELIEIELSVQTGQPMTGPAAEEAPKVKKSRKRPTKPKAAQM